MKLKDEVKLLFRKPWKILLMILIVTSFIFAILLLSVQFILDGKLLNYMEDNYSTVATTIRNVSDEKAKEEYRTLDTELVNLLEESKNISDMEVRKTVSGELEDLTSVNSFFMFPQTNHIIIFKGKLNEILENEKLGDLRYLRTNVRVDEIIGGKEGWINKNDTVHLLIIDEKGIYKELEESKEYLFIAQSSFSEKLGILNKFLYSFNLNGKANIENSYLNENNIVKEYGIVDLDDHEKLNGIQGEINRLSSEIKKLDRVVTVQMVKDMNLILPVVNEIMFLEDGRFIDQGDLGNKVCMVSSQFASKNSLAIGDDIKLGLSDDSYNIDGYESGYPRIGDELKGHYNKSESYEVVGIYSFSSYDPAMGRLLYNYNDIFIPKDSAMVSGNNISPYSMSFKINVKDLEAFESEDLPKINDLGYKLVQSESRWAQVESNFTSMSKNRIKNIMYSIILLLASSLVLNSFVGLLFKSDYMIRRIFAGEMSHINRAYKIPLVTSLIIGNIFSILLLRYFYDSLLGENLKFIPASQLLSTKSIFLYSLFILVLVDLIIILAIRVFLKKKEKKNIIELM